MKVWHNMMQRLKKTAALVLLTVLVLCGAAEDISYAAEIDKRVYTDEEEEYIKNAETLKVGYVRDRKPVSFCGTNGELSGISREIFDRISQISGLKFEYIELPEGDVTYDYLLNEGFDLVTGVEYNKQNQKAKGILISDPYLSSRKVIVARDGLSIRSDAKLTVAISTGSQTIRKVFAEQYPNFEFVDYPTIEACFNAVRNSEVDLLIQNQYVVEYWLYRPVYSNLKVVPVMELDDRLCFSAVTPLEKTDNSVWEEKELLISIINKSIAQISAGENAGYIIEATAENMYEYTFLDVLYQYRYTIIILTAAFVLTGLLLLRAINDRADAKAKGDFLSTMSHEIRTPLNGLISLNYLMAQNIEDKDKIANYLRQSSIVSEYLLALVNNILDMSKLQAGEIELEQKNVDLRLLLETVVFIEKSGMEDKGINLNTDIELIHPIVIGDAVRIQQILVNILDNSRKYTQEGGNVSIRVRQTRTPEGDIETTTDITDTGRGMSEEFQKKIFDPFTQERDTVSQGNQGTGLGMAICSLLAKQMRGSLKVESKPGEGSCFTFSFLAKPASSEDPESTADKARQKGNGNIKPRILVAEDNELNGQILVELLEGEGFEVSHVLDGKEALETFSNSREGEYGIILMDLMMPEMNGFEAAEAIRALKRSDAKTVKIFACTANSFKEDRDKAFASGMDDFITKPLNVNELLDKLRD